jgi:cytoskeletal protein CcmA (bactofilin family)
MANIPLRCNKTAVLGAGENKMFGKKGLKPNSIQTLIGASARIEGNLLFDGGCHIDGVVHGSVVGSSDSDAFLSVSEQGSVQGDVDVPRLALSGSVEGNVVVSDRVEFGPTARVNGNVHYNLIEIAAGAEINGKLIHEARQAVAPAPAKVAGKPSPVEPSLEAELEGAG